MSSSNILVVDDDPGIRKGCRRALEQEGYSVETASDAAEALAHLSRSHYDLVLTDLEMPGMNGLELLQQVRTKHPRAPVLLFTAFSTIESAGEAMRLGAAGYLTKPFQLEELYQAVHKAIREPLTPNAQAAGLLSPHAMLGSFLNLLLELAARTLQVDQAHFMIASDDGSRLVTRAAWGRTKKVRLGDTLPLSIARPSPEIRLEGPLLQDPRFKGLERFIPPFGECVPVCDGRRVLGVLIAGRNVPPGVDAAERSLLEFYAQYALILIGHYRAYHDLQATHRQLEEAQSQLVQQAKVSVVGHLVAGIVHDINNPLSSILANASNLKESVPPGPWQEDIELISKGGSAIRAIVTSLMGFIQKRPSHGGSVDPIPLIQEALQLVQFQCRMFRVKTSSNLDKAVPPVWVDPSQLSQVLMNLLMNALQALKKGGCIQVSALHMPKEVSPLERSTVRISVSDTGPGIPVELLDKIFEPFFTTKKEGEGTGLGLTRCKEIVEHHGGLIRAENDEGGGARFLIYLPAAEPGAAPTQPGKRREPQP